VRSGRDARQAGANGRFPRRTLRLSGASAGRMIRDAIEAGGELWVSGAGQSMHPTIRDADLVLLVPVDRAVRRGDIVLFPLGARLVLHRVERLQGSAVLTKGDAREMCDPPIVVGNVLARAVAVRGSGPLTLLAPSLRFGARPLMEFLLRDVHRRARRIRRRLNGMARGTQRVR